MDRIRNILINSKYSVFTMLAILVLMIGGIIYYFIYLVPNFAQSNKPLKASITYVDGIVELQREKINDWVIANKGDTLNQGDSIRTSVNSKAIIKFENESILRLDQSSEIYLSSTITSNIQINQVSGESYSKIVKSKTDKYHVNTQEVDVTAFGTTFIYKVTTNKINIYTYEGSVNVNYKDEDRLLPTMNKMVIDLTNKTSNMFEITEVEFKDSFVQWNIDKDNDTSDSKFDTNIPVISVISPEDKSSTMDNIIELRGFISDDSLVKKVFVNNIVYMIMDEDGYGFNVGTGEFKVKVDLVDGENIFQVKAYDIYWNTSETKILTINKNNSITPTPSTAVVESEFIISTQTGSITSPGIGKLYVRWTLSNLTANNGFFVVISTSGNPVYPFDRYLRVEGANIRDITWGGIEAGTYNVRVCIYDGEGNCSKYTNLRTVTIEGEATPTPSPTVAPTAVTVTPTTGTTPVIP
jgi:hypothetical protein